MDTRWVRLEFVDRCLQPLQRPSDLRVSRSRVAVVALVAAAAILLWLFGGEALPAVVLAAAVVTWFSVQLLSVVWIEVQESSRRR